MRTLALAVVAGAGVAPLDRGSRLWSGARSVESSLPELAFVNVRKGTMAYGLQALGDVEASAVAAAPPPSR